MPLPANATPATFRWVSVSAAYGHSLALANDCNVYAWGVNGNGQVGAGDTNNQPAPVPVQSLGGLWQQPAPRLLSALAAPHSAGPFQFTVQGTPGHLLVLQYSTNLTSWTSFQTNYQNVDVSPVADPAATGAPKRFYRAQQTQ